jgi:GTP-binding protein
LPDRDELTAQVERQIEAAIDQASLLLFVVDIRAGVMPLDELVAGRLRQAGRPVILVANKCDSEALEPQAAEFYQLGDNPVVPVSAQQDRGKQALLDLILKHLSPHEVSAGNQPNVPLKIAIVGRRNTGKSTFINSIAQEERVIVSEVPGTTRDSVDVRFECDGKTFVAIDTAGVRRKSSVATAVEFYSLARAERSIRRADIVLLFLDAQRSISKVDKQLADYILDNYKPAIFVVNKWDLLLPTPTGRFGDYLRATFPNLDFVPIAFITAKSGKNVRMVLNLAQNLHKQASARISTGDLNRVLRFALAQQSPPQRQNRTPKIFYGTQVGTNPPTIVLFTNGPKLFDNTYRRYLLKTFRDQLPFHEVSIKLHLRSKRREDRLPVEDGEETAGDEAPAPRQRRFKTRPDRAKGPHPSPPDAKTRRSARSGESELWKDV